ncbi:STAS domain-containing protein [Desulfovibrio sp. TomC]|uniref:STAS domain-containing protein n=1 Tax=Desulfovibrio sp. TomC TaxID=1562888 RepID=UPI0005B87552|nr:STAS domain-containing protein [Desulfovibrio sp. TomC]
MSRIAIANQHGVLWARTDGPLSAPVSLELETAVLEAATVGRYQVIVLDLSQSPTVDSSGVGALVRLQTALATKGRRLILANPTTAVADELRLRDLYAFFQISHDLHPDMDQEELLLASDL